jgi:hypothetical protein
VSSIANKLKAIRDMINEQTDMDGAQAYIASDKVHAWEILLNKPGVAKVAVGFESEKARVNFAGGDITGRTNQTLYAAISRGRGLNQTRSDNLIVGSGGGQPLFQLAEKMRDKMRTMAFSPTNDEIPDYIGLEDFGKEWGVNADAYICRIWVGTQLPLAVTPQLNQLPV